MFIYVKDALALRERALKYLGVKGPPVCNLLTNGSEKNKCVERERDRDTDKASVAKY